eukprot:TRINITY_DN6862_c0_g1_i4.p1 TRINITY_DN6862_c0_g1~~TRINITY_DN6862_c0_g1_i4.p1  ORF type:complete len:129 (+),score=31.55 TRINITY_DN6862_c0_g1_i4:111-497(+)
MMSCFSPKTERNTIPKVLGEEMKIKVLVLGSGGTGKSTFLKQVIFSQDNEFPQLERMKAQTKVGAVSCVFYGLRVLIDISQQMEMREILEDEEIFNATELLKRTSFSVGFFCQTQDGKEGRYIIVLIC